MTGSNNMFDFHEDVTEKARKAILRDGGSIAPIQQGNETLYRVEFPEGSVALGNGEVKLPSGAVIGWDGSIDIEEVEPRPLYLKRGAKK
jgi:hypothetical protein